MNWVTARCDVMIQFCSVSLFPVGHHIGQYTGAVTAVPVIFDGKFVALAGN